MLPSNPLNQLTNVATQGVSKRPDKNQIPVEEVVAQKLPQFYWRANNVQDLLRSADYSRSYFQDPFKHLQEGVDFRTSYDPINSDVGPFNHRRRGITPFIPMPAPVHFTPYNQAAELYRLAQNAASGQEEAYQTRKTQAELLPGNQQLTDLEVEHKIETDQVDAIGDQAKDSHLVLDNPRSMSMEQAEQSIEHTLHLVARLNPLMEAVNRIQRLQPTFTRSTNVPVEIASVDENSRIPERNIDLSEEAAAAEDQIGVNDTRREIDGGKMGGNTHIALGKYRIGRRALKRGLLAVYHPSGRKVMKNHPISNHFGEYILNHKLLPETTRAHLFDNMPTHEKLLLQQVVKGAGFKDNAVASTKSMDMELLKDLCGSVDAGNTRNPVEGEKLRSLVTKMVRRGELTIQQQKAIEANWIRRALVGA